MPIHPSIPPSLAEFHDAPSPQAMCPRVPGLTRSSRMGLDAVACPGCDLLQRLPPVPRGGRARCPRCGEILATSPRDPVDRPLALALAAAILFLVANLTPLMGISAVGRHAQTTILGGALDMMGQGQMLTGALVAVCAAIAPAVYIALILSVLIAVRRPPAPPWAGALLRLAEHVQLWSMPEVMLLGILVALVKIGELATVLPGAGLYAAGALPLLLAAVAVSFDPGALWERVDWADGEAPSPMPTEPDANASADTPSQE